MVQGSARGDIFCFLVKHGSAAQPWAKGDPWMFGQYWLQSDIMMSSNNFKELQSYCLASNYKNSYINFFKIGFFEITEPSLHQIW